MGLLQRIFGSDKGGAAPTASGPATSLFRESGDDHRTPEGAASRNAPRRELLQVVLRDTMRKHGIPSDWIEARILSSVSRSGRSGLHMTFVVRQAHEQLLGYVFAFQDSFEQQLASFEPRASDWLVSLAWEFIGAPGKGMPDPRSWARPVLSESGHAPVPPGAKQPLNPPAQRAVAPTGNGVGLEPSKNEEDVQRDLDALFAIRDAAIADAAGKSPEDQPDFEATQPFDPTEPEPRPRR